MNYGLLGTIFLVASGFLYALESAVARFYRLLDLQTGGTVPQYPVSNPVVIAFVLGFLVLGLFLLIRGWFLDYAITEHMVE